MESTNVPSGCPQCANSCSLEAVILPYRISCHNGEFDWPFVNLSASKHIWSVTSPVAENQYIRHHPACGSDSFVSISAPYFRSWPSNLFYTAVLINSSLKDDVSSGASLFIFVKSDAATNLRDVPIADNRGRTQ